MAGVVELEPTLTVLETAVLPITPNPYMAAGVGFEPTGLLHPSVFKTAAINHSANLPNRG